MAGARHCLSGPALRCATAAATFALLSCALDPAPASARGYRAPQVPPPKREAATPPPSALLTVVSIAKQHVTVYGASGVIGRAPISSGRPGHATPTGVFTILQKNRFHRSNIYSGAPMPFMQRLTWSGIALHAGALPGFPASHGCIRLPAAFASDLWGMTRLGARVVVVPDDTPALEVAHASLPTPFLVPATAEAPSATRTAELTPAAADPAEKSDAIGAEPQLLNPIERARRGKAALAADAEAKLLEAKGKVALSAAKAKEANAAIMSLRNLERQLADAQARIEQADKAQASARTPDQTQRARVAYEQAQARIVELRKLVAEAGEREATVTAEAFDAARAAWDAEKASDAATIAAKSAEKASSGEPISIFVSRKTGRVQVRQAWETLHDAPATFKGGAEPLGTHVYVAVEPVGRGESLRWLSVSFRGAGPVPEIKPYQYRRAAPPPPPTPVSKETAQSVLDKFEIGEASRKFIAERLWIGATLIISDQGLSHEASHHTDFVVLTR